MTRRRVAVAILVSAATLVAALMAEGVVRLVAPQTLSLPWPVVNGIRVGEPNARGHIAVHGQFDTAVTFNSQGFRAPHDFALRPPPHRTRIAILGDSFIFGWGADERHAFPAQLESLLRAAGQDVEVINAGIPGQSLGEKAIWYRDAVARFHPDIVLTEILIDDADSENGVHAFTLRNGAAVPLVPSVTTSRATRSRWYSLPLYGWLSEHSQAVALAKRAVAVMLMRQRRNTGNPLLWNSPARRQAFAAEDLPLLEAEIVWLNDAVTKNGGKLVVMTFPVRESIYGGAMSSQINSRYAVVSRSMADICRRERIPFADLQPHVTGEARRIGRQLYYSGNETHPNVPGYNALAAGAAPFIMDLLRRR
jgi:lysophospholipase L1-like esterase